MPTRTDLQARLKDLGERLRKTRPGTRSYDILMLEIDKLLGTEESTRDPELEAEWEKNNL